MFSCGLQIHIKSYKNIHCTSELHKSSGWRQFSRVCAQIFINSGPRVFELHVTACSRCNRHCISETIMLYMCFRFPQLFHGHDIPEGVAANQPIVTRECTKKEIYNISCATPGMGTLTASRSDDLTFYIGQSLVHQYGRNKPPLSARSRPFSCEVCGKRFTLRGSLKTHEKLHTFRQSYHCHVCGKKFKVEGGLKSHSVLHTNHRPFLCVVCGRGFTLKGSLKTHLTLHSVHRASYPCDICGKTYKGKASYDSHRAQHLGQSLHPCEVCGKNFTLKGSLKLHSMLHTGIKPYTCHVCGMSFAVRSHLTRHFQLHNPA